MATTPEISPAAYIPVGCLVFSSDAPSPSVLAIADLSKAGWIRVEHIANINGSFTTRVYVLPDDVQNARLPRSDPRLRRARNELVASLDFSLDSWNATGLANHLQRQPSLAHHHFDDQNMSLLQMFNAIPSPAPDTTIVINSVPRQFMSNLLASAVDGLITEMYPYQSRSAALMLQRETAPAKYPDSRLCKVFDQNRDPYYYDSVTGEIRKEPRYYDASRGGILAEEMGSGKTLICLALIAATRHQPAAVPDLYQGNNVTIRPRVGSLMDMAAAVVTKNFCPWPIYLDPGYGHCIQAIKRNPGWYCLPRPAPRRPSRTPQEDRPPDKIYLSHASLVVVPTNLLEQWLQEISKHTQGLKVHVLRASNKKPTVFPAIKDLILYDMILCSTQTLEKLWQGFGRSEQGHSWTFDCVLGRIRFKRCIVDEGHKLGNSGLGGARTNLLRALNSLHVDARWIATGTPSKGLYGTEQDSANTSTLAASVAKQERQDLERIGSIATSYLKARPWSNTILDYGDTPAHWRVYVMQPSHSAVSNVRRDCLRFTLNSLIIRHRLSEVNHLLPDVGAKVVRLEGSYQDKLSLNLFSMIIIFNAVQSERRDRDYFFHPLNRKSLLELVYNLRQAGFFGGSFFSAGSIQKAVETAEDFLNKRSVPITATDEELLRSAIAFGKVAAQNQTKQLAHVSHEIPIYVQHFPSGAGSAWSMDGKDEAGLVCTNSQMMVAAQKLLRPFLDSPTALNTYLNAGMFKAEGNEMRQDGMEQACEESPAKASASTNLAGNTSLGEDRVSNRKRHSTAIKFDAKPNIMPTPPRTPEESVEIAAPLSETQLVSTTSAKLSYLIDAIVKHQKDEQIVVFYENDNVAWYLAGILEMLQVRHLIYAKNISSTRRAQYISTFNHSTKFRVLFMDVSQAAFGLDLRSASRIYFINPVHNPQVEAQAIGRVRRISQKKKVTVETLVLKDSLEEVIAERKNGMDQTENRNFKTILDDRPIYEWILNPRIIPLPDVLTDDGPGQMARLAAPQYIFGREFGREVSHPDEDILLNDPSASAGKGKQPAVHDEKSSEAECLAAPRAKFGHLSRARIQSPSIRSSNSSATSSAAPSPRLQSVKRARFANVGESDESFSSAAESAELPPARPAKCMRFVDDGDAT